jgi:hypothetical protein
MSTHNLFFSQNSLLLKVLLTGIVDNLLMALPPDGIRRLLDELFLSSDSELLKDKLKTLRIGELLRFRAIEDGMMFSVKYEVENILQLRATENEIIRVFQDLDIPFRMSKKSTRWFGLIDEGKPRFYGVLDDGLMKAVHSHTTAKALHDKMVLAGEIKYLTKQTYPDDPISEDMMAWAMALKGTTSLLGPYFPTSALKNLSDSSSLLYEVKFTLTKHKLGHTFHENPSLLDSTLAAIEEFGFRRLSFCGRGSSSFAFKGVRDKEDNPQLVLITPGNQERVPHPCILPAIEQKIIGNKEILVRIMPGLDTDTEITEHHMDQLKSLMNASGLYTSLTAGNLSEIRPGNVGLYTFINEAGETKTVPMILDWGAISWNAPDKPMPTIEQQQAMRERWEKTPELQDWLEAERSIAKQAQNVYRGEQLDALPQEGTVAKSLHKGLYPPEVGVLSQMAINEALQGTRAYHEVMRELVESQDLSLSPSVLIYR